MGAGRQKPATFPWPGSDCVSFPLSQASLTSQDFALSKCFLPQEDTVLATYCGVAGLLAILLLTPREWLASLFLSGWNALRTHRAW